MRGFILIILLSLPLTSQAQEREKTIVASEEVTVRVSALQVVETHMRNHVDLDNHGLRYIIKIPARKKGDPALKVEVEGPLIKRVDQPGLVITIRY